jgi:lipopolysaccharide/colanic/teichoic acid biosynthesis glycosyltransferase
MGELLAMSQIARALGFEGYSPAGEWHTLFRMKPAHRHELVFGFLLRLIIGLVAVALPSMLMVLVGALNGWQLTDGLLVFYGCFICLIVLVGEHIRSRIYERSVTIIEPGGNVGGTNSDVSLPKGIAEEARKRRASNRLAAKVFKRLFDIVFVSLALTFFSWLMLIIVIAIKFESKGPVLFRQARKGFNGRSFVILKFRTMSVMENGSSVLQATRDDPRVTKVGRYLRVTSLDELPQLFNVLVGDMSLVGPRPHALAHDNHFEQMLSDYAFRHQVKPGITGWAQVNGARGATATIEHISERVKLDLWYIDNWSLWLDIIILFRTSSEMLKNRNAY